mmetsp:Transcript_29857/g.64341  ORF Transcript_29857/g.64341 Transcript_29857/m.64341 type:complete len:202 (-) Transcript_29857:1293-1898(-)
MGHRNGDSHGESVGAKFRARLVPRYGNHCSVSAVHRVHDRNTDYQAAAECHLPPAAEARHRVRAGHSPAAGGRHSRAALFPSLPRVEAEDRRASGSRYHPAHHQRRRRTRGETGAQLAYSLGSPAGGQHPRGRGRFQQGGGRADAGHSAADVAQYADRGALPALHVLRRAARAALPGPHPLLLLALGVVPARAGESGPGYG